MAPAFQSGKPPSYAKLTNESDDLDDDYVVDQRRVQQIERQKQDESLEELHLAVKRLGDMSLNISTELDTQNKSRILPNDFVAPAAYRMLDELSDDTDKAKEALEIVTKRTQELIKQSGGMKTFIVIIVLVLILLLLTYLVIMT
ncbi:hypothetical protein PsorP6_018406 [Peronosclerospora sorghi]|nr:hypothetical protein PsorP6_018406 [Peronosclerospora sorghi]